MPTHEKPDYSKMRQVITERMETSRHTVYTLANEANVSRITVYRFLRGTTVGMRPENFARVGKALGFDYKKYLP